MTVHRRCGSRAAFVIALCVTLAACATDPQRTRTEGTLVGAGAGAAIGRAITGDDGGTFIGAAIGAAIGFVAGNRTAKKKAEYAQREDALRESARRAEAIAQAAREENDQLARDIADLESVVDQLRQVEASAQTKQARLDASARRHEALAAAADARLAQVREEYARQRTLVQSPPPAQPAESGAGRQPSEGFRLVQASMRELEAEERRLERAKEQLRLIDMRRVF